MFDNADDAGSRSNDGGSEYLPDTERVPRVGQRAMSG